MWGLVYTKRDYKDTTEYNARIDGILTLKAIHIYTYIYLYAYTYLHTHIFLNNCENLNVK